MEISETTAIEELNAEFYAAFEAGDLDRMADVWADDKDAVTGGVVCVHPGGPMVRGRGAVLRSWALIMANTSYIQFVLTDVATKISGDIAVLTCAENIITASDDEAGFAAGGHVATTNAFVRTHSGWRMWLHHGSPVMLRVEEG